MASDWLKVAASDNEQALHKSSAFPFLAGSLPVTVNTPCVFSGFLAESQFWEVNACIRLWVRGKHPAPSDANRNEWVLLKGAPKHLDRADIEMLDRAEKHRLSFVRLDRKSPDGYHIAYHLWLAITPQRRVQMLLYDFSD